VNLKQRDFYNSFRSGMPLFYIFYLYLKEELHIKPDPSQFYEFPQDRAEQLNNLNYVVQIQYKINVPIYLTPQDYIDHFEPNFLMLQLYYLYCKFKHSKPTIDKTPDLAFKD